MHISAPAAKGSGGAHPTPDQNISCLLDDRLFFSNMATGKVVFISKPDRNTYSGPRDYRPISLTSFSLKPMERLMDRYPREEAMAIVSLHPNQHAY